MRIKRFVSEKGLCPKNCLPPSQIRHNLPPSILILAFVFIALPPKSSENSKSLSKINSGPQAIGLRSSKHTSPDHKVEVANVSSQEISDERADKATKKMKPTHLKILSLGLLRAAQGTESPARLDFKDAHATGDELQPRTRPRGLSKPPESNLTPRAFPKPDISSCVPSRCASETCSGRTVRG